MDNVIYLNDYKKKHDIPLTHSPYYALNADREELRLAFERAFMLIQEPIDANGTLPYAVLVGYENKKTGKVKLLKEMRMYPNKEAFESMAGLKGSYCLALVNDSEKSEAVRKPLEDCVHKITDDEVKEAVRLPVSIFGKRDMFTVDADGNGMTDFGIDDGDTLFFESNRVPKPGDVVVVETKEHGRAVRQLLVDKSGGTYIFHAKGKEPREDIMSREPEIYGVLVYILKPFRTNP